MSFLMMNTRCSKHVEDTKNWTKTLIWKVCIMLVTLQNTGLSKKMDGIWNRNNLKSTGRIYTFGVL